MCQTIHGISHPNSERKKWVETNDDSRETYNTNIQIKFKTSMLKPSSGNYSDAYTRFFISNSIFLVLTLGLFSKFLANLRFQD